MHRILCAIAGLPTILLVAGTARADDYVVRMEPARHVCQVDYTSEPRGHLEQISSPYALRSDACNQALNLHPSQCWTYIRRTGEQCHLDGVDLPPPFE
jgi:hypothetical protein